MFAAQAVEINYDILTTETQSGVQDPVKHRGWSTHVKIVNSFYSLTVSWE